MGIRLDYLELIRVCLERLSTSAPSVWIMGSQDCRFTLEQANRWLARRGYSPLRPADWDGRPAPVLAAMGAGESVDLDINGNARLHLDLTQPLPSEHVGRADLVIESGTLEHIFDPCSAIQNINRLLKAGGIVLHLSPVTFFEHGFFSFNPRFFNAFYAGNDYTPELSTFHVAIPNPVHLPRFTPSIPKDLGRFNLPFAGSHQRDWVTILRKLSQVANLPRRLIFVGAYRKPDRRTTFKTPDHIEA